MPFSHIGRFIARLVEVFRQRLNRQRQFNAVGVASGFSGIHSALQAGTGRTAYRLAGIGIFKQGALLRQLVQIGAYRQGLPIASQGIPPLLIGKIEDQIGSFHR